MRTIYAQIPQRIRRPNWIRKLPYWERISRNRISRTITQPIVESWLRNCVSHTCADKMGHQGKSEIQNATTSGAPAGNIKKHLGRRESYSSINAIQIKKTIICEKPLVKYLFFATGASKKYKQTAQLLSIYEKVQDYRELSNQENN